MIEIRDMELKDIARVMEIEAITFKAPWKEDEMLYELNKNTVKNPSLIHVGDIILT